MMLKPGVQVGITVGELRALVCSRLNSLGTIGLSPQTLMLSYNSISIRAANEDPLSNVIGSDIFEVARSAAPVI